MKCSKCKKCGYRVSLFTKQCPECGTRILHPIFCLLVAIVLIAVVFLLPDFILPTPTESMDYNQNKPNPPSSGSYTGSEDAESTIIGNDNLVLGPGTYVVGEDIAAGKYDCLAASGFGVLRGDVASMEPAGFVQTMGGVSASVGGETASVQGTTSYSNLTLTDGDILYIEMSLNVEFVLK